MPFGVKLCPRLLMVFTFLNTNEHTPALTAYRVFFSNQQKKTQEDLEFLRNQSITVEVNMARLYNYDVIRRRKVAEEKKANEETKASS